MKKERGAFLIIFCLVLTTLLSVSLAVLDVSNQRAEADHARHFVKLAALEALRGYQDYQDKNPNSEEDKWKAAAVAAANKYLNQVDISHQVFKNPTDKVVNGHYDHHEISVANTYAENPEELELELGYWVNCRNPIEQVFDFCKDKTSGIDIRKQDFVDIAKYRNTIKDNGGSSNGIGNPNSVRIQGKWLQDSKTYVLGRLLAGGDRIAPTVSATAMIIPRHIYFLVDISDSGDFDTFSVSGPKYVMCDKKRGDNCYKLFTNPPWDGLPDARNGDKNLSNFYKDDYVRKIVLGDSDYDELPDKDIHPSPSEENGKYSFKKLSESCVEMATSLGIDFGGSGSWCSGNAGNARNAFMVHAYNPVGGGAPLPEPLTSILNGVHSAIDTIQRRHVTGDKVGLIFFTNGLVWPRITKLTDNFDALKNLTNYVGRLENGKVLEDDLMDIDFASVGDLINDSNSGLERAIRYSIFPIPSVKVGEEKFEWTFSNIREALSVATKYIESDEGVTSSKDALDPNISRGIVLFSDGLTNCVLYSQDHKYHCGDTEVSYLQSLNQVQTLVMTDHHDDRTDKYVHRDDSLQAKGIPFHVFQVGAKVGPHTVVIKKDDGSGECYTDAECRKGLCQGASYVATDAAPNGRYDNGNVNIYPITREFNNMSASNPFLYASAKMYEMARATQGLYIPLRPVDEEWCQVNQCSESHPCDCLPSANTGDLLTKDPKCRSVAKQVADGFDDILAVNPYRLVDVR